MNGIICVDKPKDFTSFDVVAVMRKCFDQKKIGHGGTLDPMATGVLPIFLGRATKSIDLIENQEKKYEAEFIFGISTDTLDITGKVLSKFDTKVSQKDFEDVIKTYIGNIEQIPPMYSAIKIDGVKLYKLAREGKQVERKPRSVTIEDIKTLFFDEKNQKGKIEVWCSKGTYIRSLIDDIGKSLGTGATLTELRRTRSTIFDISECYTIDDIKKFKLDKILEKKIYSVEKIFEYMDTISLDKDGTEKILNGIKLDLDLLNYSKKVINSEKIKLKDYEGKFLGIGNINADINKLEIYKFMF
ncbi:MAG: tRNA pseudouridine(55) synthase TruB [Oscillospiraceae bacterium]|nr:tRNA pseudouridine(55) synthase TruB [Oscillospiraceae bacterium]